jgi:hypothetical protein
MRVLMDKHLAWQCWCLKDHRGRPTLIVGPERWAQLVWLTVQPLLFETDSGPLDAKVP